MIPTAASGTSILELTPDEREELDSWLRSHSTSKARAFRAALIMALADGSSYREIERRLGASAPTVSLWKKRFIEARLRGLRGRHQGSKPRVAIPDVRTRVIQAQKRLEANGSRCSSRRLAKELELHRSTVQRILSQVALPTGKIARLMADWYPKFDDDMAEIIGLYLRRRHYAVIFVVRDRLDRRKCPSLRPGFDYHRHCSEALYAALKGRQDRGNRNSDEQHTPAGFTEFLTSLFANTAWARRVHVIHYNLEQETDDVGRLPHLPHIWSYSLSRYTTWLEMVRFWLNKIERDTIQDKDLGPRPNLFQRLLTSIRNHVKDVRHFGWITSARLEGWSQVQIRRKPPKDPGFALDRIRRAEVLSIWDP